MQRLSFGIVIAALLVSAPRLTLAFLFGDGIQVPERVEIGILTVTGVGSGLVLTVGNAVLAHALAIKAQQRSWLWWLEAGAWLLFLVGAVVVMSPTLVAGLEKSSLATVLQSSQAKWLWAITAVVIVELLVGAAMAASILAQTESTPLPTTTTSSSRWGRLGDALVSRLEQAVAPTPPATFTPPTPVPPVQPPAAPASATDVRPARPKRRGESAKADTDKEQVLATMLEIYRQHPQVTVTEVGQQIQRSAPTVRAYRKELQARGQLPVNGQEEGGR
jgi:hypothetical protein